MKKSVLTALLILAYAASQAQSFNLVNPTTHYSNANTAQVSQGFATINNSSASSKNVMVERTVNNLAPGHTGYFCWDVCYGESVNLSSGYLTIAAGANNSSFYCDIDPHGSAGVDSVCYSFFDMTNSADHVDICMYFDIGTGISTVDASATSPLSAASPNPANTLSGISYNTDVTKNPKLVIYDLLGGKVFETRLIQKQGAFILNVSDFKQGVYVYSLVENDKIVATRKLVVTHK